MHELLKQLKQFFGLHKKKKSSIRVTALVRVHLSNTPSGSTSLEVADALHLPMKQVGVALSYLCKTGYAIHAGQRDIDGRSLRVYKTVDTED